MGRSFGSSTLTPSDDATAPPAVAPMAANGHAAGAAVATAPLQSNDARHADPDTLLGLVRAMYQRGWRVGHVAAAATLIAAAVGLTWEGWTDLAWLAVYDPESSQILVAPIIFAWLLWTRRERLAEVAPGFSWLGPLLIALAWAAWEIGFYHNVRVAGHLAAVGLAVGCLLSVTGSRPFWKLLPVFGVLLFLIPVPHTVRLPLSVPLQRLSAQATEHLMSLAGIGIERAGSILTLNGVDVGVAEACNGMRMVFTVFLVTYLVVFSSSIRPSLRVLVLALAPLLSLVCNVIRLVPTVYLYGYASDDVAEAFHDFSGWIMNAVAFVILLGVIALIRWTLGENAEAPARPRRRRLDVGRRATPPSSPRHPRGVDP